MLTLDIMFDISEKIKKLYTLRFKRKSCYIHPSTSVNAFDQVQPNYYSDLSPPGAQIGLMTCSRFKEMQEKITERELQKTTAKK